MNFHFPFQTIFWQQIFQEENLAVIIAKERQYQFP
jgi:hypothetical protein